MQRVTLTILVMLITVPPCAGQADADRRYESPQQWFDAEWERAGRKPEWEWISIKWTQEDRWVPPQAEINRIRRDIAGKPDHPERLVLADLEKRLMGEFQVGEFAIWFGERGSLRFNHHSRTEPGDYFDRTITPQSVWGLTPRGLALLDPDSSEPGYNFVAAAVGAEFIYSQFVDGGLGALRRAEVPKGSLKQSGDSLVIDCRGGPRIADARVFARWDTALARGFIERIDIRWGSEKSAGGTLHVSGWTLDSVLNCWAASEVHSVPMGQAAGLLWKRGVTELVTRDRFADLCRVPSADGADVIRGPATFMVIEDRRSAHRQLTTIGDGGTLAEPLPPLPHDSNRKWITITGWIVAASLAATLFFLRLRQGLLRRSASQ
ncbi:MAG: hypothetical protein KF699_03610 [Phycisphaeraceae bacterium]|nr:hypothetical protein [Phycisphaeraceae bacterium]